MAVSTKITALHRLEALVYDLFMGRFEHMPIDKASDAGAGWVRALGPLTPAHKTALNNLRMAYPDETEERRAAIASDMWAELGRWAGEFPHLPELRAKPGNGRIEIAGEEHLEAVRESGKGAIFVSAHFSNFEVAAIALVQSGLRCRITYRPLNNPIIDRKWKQVRSGYGTSLHAPKGVSGGLNMMRSLQAGESVAIMNDQKYNEGVAAPFFGYDAMTADGPARLALRFGTPLVPLRVRRLDKSAHFRVELSAPIPVDRSLPPDEAVKQTVFDITKWVEANARATPEQWWWMHNRWPKTAWAKAGIT